MSAFAHALEQWHDLYILIGTAAATLVGLLFVAVSVGASVFSEANRPAALRVFLTQSVVHFTSSLVAALVALAPIEHATVLALLIGGLGAFGCVYCALVWRTLLRSGLGATIDTEDRVWYAALPAVAYMILLAAGAMLAMRNREGLAALALGMGLLLLVGIRNAWDITVWCITRRRE